MFPARIIVTSWQSKCQNAKIYPLAPAISWTSMKYYNKLFVSIAVCVKTKFRAVYVHAAARAINKTF